MTPGGDDGNGLLARGWTPSRRLRASTFLVIGVLLIAHPLVGGLPDAVGFSESVEYDAIEVAPDGDGLTFSGVTDQESAWVKIARSGGLSFIDCYTTLGSRECWLESALVDHTVTVESEPPDWQGYTYHDGFYERVAFDRGDAVEIGLRPVSARTVLSNVSVPARDWNRQTRRAVERGSLRTDSRLAFAGAILERNGSYLVVVPDAEIPEDEPVDPVVGTMSAVLGTLAMVRGKRELEGS